MPPDRAPPPIDLHLALSTGTSPSGAVLSPGLLASLRSSEATLRAALTRYGAAAIATAFNGGKDATVVLHLARAVLLAPDLSLTCMYLVEPDAFPSVDAFVRETVAAYGVRAVAQEGGFKEGIRRFVEERGVQAFVMGTRRSDPGGAGLQPLEASSQGWPVFMRVNPILEWEYAHVWEFLRAFEIPYCRLYDRGYTSLGNARNTKPNPALLMEGGEEGEDEGRRRYLPAWRLDCQELERAGRGV